MSEHLGARIRKVRKLYGMPVAVLAARAGISRHQLDMIEAGTTKSPKADTILGIAAALGVSTDYVLKGGTCVATIPGSDSAPTEPTLVGGKE